MHAALMQPKPEIIMILLKAGAKVDDRDITGMTPFMIFEYSISNPALGAQRFHSIIDI
jgi:ankyrin repeat protein